MLATSQYKSSDLQFSCPAGEEYSFSSSSLFKIPSSSKTIQNFNAIKSYKSISSLFHKDVTDRELLEMKFSEEEHTLLW